ncbi:MAG: rod-binding protein [Lachnospiraceae bacterium]
MSDLINGLSGSFNAAVNNDTTQATSALKDKLDKSDLSKATDEELMEVCKDFEAYFVEQMFKAMEKMSHITSDDDDDDDSAISSNYATQMKDYFQDELMSKYAENASESNGGEGLGIAQMLYEQMKRNYDV